jgi:hypothetical protein
MPQIQQVEQRMNENFIFAMASGQVGDELKFYFHCQLGDKSGYALAEIVFKQSLNTVSGTLKTTRGDLGQKLIKKVEDSLSIFT